MLGYFIGGVGVIFQEGSRGLGVLCRRGRKGWRTLYRGWICDDRDERWNSKNGQDEMDMCGLRFEVE